MRMASILAAVDGEVSIADNEAITAMKRQFDELQGNAPEHLASETDTQNARDALTWLRDEAKRLREGVGVTAAEKPTPMAGPGAAATKPATPPATAPADDRTPQQRLRRCSREARSTDWTGSDQRADPNFDQLPEDGTSTRGGRTTDDQASLHMSFVGNPGTGKTSVARIIAEIYGALGILTKGHLVETDRSGLVAEYAGRPAPRPTPRSTKRSTECCSSTKPIR